MGRPNDARAITAPTPSRVIACKIKNDIASGSRNDERQSNRSTRRSRRMRANYKVVSASLHFSPGAGIKRAVGSVSHSRTVASPEPETSVCPSGLKASEKDIIRVSLEPRHLFAGCRVPKQNSTVTPGRGHSGARWVENCREYFIGVAQQELDRRARGHVPDADRLVTARPRPSGCHPR